MRDGDAWAESDIAVGYRQQRRMGTGLDCINLQ